MAHFDLNIFKAPNGHSQQKLVFLVGAKNCGLDRCYQMAMHNHQWAIELPEKFFRFFSSIFLARDKIPNIRELFWATDLDLA